MKSIEAILDVVAQRDMGVYPQSWTQDGVTTKRTEWQDGWNAYATKLLEKQIKIREWFFDLDEKYQEIVEDMLLEGGLSIIVGDEKVVLTYDTSDLFAWGYADCEAITSLELLDEIYRVWKQHPLWGIEAWHCKRMNEQPQWPVEESMRKSGAWDDEMDALPPCGYDEDIGRWKKTSKEEAVKELLKNL